MVRVNIHDGTGVNCNMFYDGDVCISASAGGNCTAMTKGEAYQLAVDLLRVVQELEQDND